MRIVSLLSSATEILFALGLGEQVLAVSHGCDYPATARKLPRATRPFIDSSQSSDQIDKQVRSLIDANAALYEIDAALLCRLRPDLIITQAQCDVCAVRHQDVIDLVQSEPALRQTLVLALNPQSLEEIFGDVERIAAATGCATQGQAFQRSLIKRVDDVREKTAAIPDDQRPRVVCLEWLSPLMAAGNWTPRLIALAGGVSGLASAGEHSGYVELSQVIDFDPQVMILAPCGFDLPRTIAEAQILVSDSRWTGIAACRNDRVYAVDGNAYINRSGPRIVDSLEMLAHLLHPELVGAPTWAAPGAQPWTSLHFGNGSI